MQNINEFMKGLLKEKGISVDPEIEKDLIADMRKQLEEQINRACVQALNEDQAKELSEKIDQPDFTAENIAEFMQKSGVNFAEITKNTMDQFRNFYLGEEKN